MSEVPFVPFITLSMRHGAFGVDLGLVEGQTAHIMCDQVGDAIQVVQGVMPLLDSLDYRERELRCLRAEVEELRRVAQQSAKAESRSRCGYLEPDAPMDEGFWTEAELQREAARGREAGLAEHRGRTDSKLVDDTGWHAAFAEAYRDSSTTDVRGRIGGLISVLHTAISLGRRASGQVRMNPALLGAALGTLYAVASSTLLAEATLDALYPTPEELDEVISCHYGVVCDRNHIDALERFRVDYTMAHMKWKASPKPPAQAFPSMLLGAEGSGWAHPLEKAMDEAVLADVEQALGGLPPPPFK
jgi:hypothetical protein